METETLRRTAGQLAARGDGPQLGIVGIGSGWGEAVHRAALLLEPAWPQKDPKLIDPDAEFGLETLALLLYVRGDEHGGAAQVPLTVLLEDLENAGLEDLLRQRLETAGHHAGNGQDLIAKTLEILTEKPLPDLMALPSIDEPRRESLLDAGRRWAAGTLRQHHRPPALDKGTP